MSKFDEIKEKVSKDSIFIKRVPEKTKIRFQEIAKEEFADDWGMALKWLIDFRDGLLSSPNQILLEHMESMANELASLKQSEPEVQEEEKKNAIKSLSGKKIAEKKG